MDLADAQQEFLRRVEAFWQIMGWAGAPVKFHSFYRSPQEQNELYQAGKSAARAYQSAHNFGLAADYHFDPQGWKVPEEWWQFGDQVARYVGLETGISWKDANHIQLPGWKLWKSF